MSGREYGPHFDRVDGAGLARERGQRLAHHVRVREVPGLRAGADLLSDEGELVAGNEDPWVGEGSGGRERDVRVVVGLSVSTQGVVGQRGGQRDSDEMSGKHSGERNSKGPVATGCLV